VRDVVLITGASSELGRCLLSALARTDAVVYAHYASGLGKLETHLATLSGTATFVPVAANFSSLADTDAMIDVIRTNHQRPNKIVHLSAIPLTLERFAKVHWERVEADWNVSVRSIAHIGRAFLPGLAKEGTGARVVFALSSVTLGVPPKGMAAYTTVKYALLGLMRSLAAEYAGSGIRINAVSPYTMETDFLAGVPHKFAELAASQNPAGRNATPADVVPAIEFLLSEESRFITGTNISVTAGAAF
jgi:3-oxoacyl-[acyl-carrier protein] reductase